MEKGFCHQIVVNRPEIRIELKYLDHFVIVL